jgi:hypothetical protein
VTHSPVIAAASIASTLAVLWLLLRLWRTRVAGRGVALVDLLPRGRAWLVLLALLLVDYALLGAFMRRAELPPLRGQIGVWVLYAAFGALWWRVARRAPVRDASLAPVPAPALALPSTRRLVITFAAASLVTATLTMPVGGLVVIIPLWLFGIAVGLAAFVALLREAVRRPA